MTPSFKTCPRCQTDVLYDTPLCPRCGYLYPITSASETPPMPSVGDKKIPLSLLLAIFFLMVVMVAGTLIYAVTDRYPFLGTWIGEPSSDHPAVTIHVGKDGIAETNFRYQENLTLLIQPEST